MDKNKPPTESAIPHAEETETATPHWGYKGKIGPKYWGNLSNEFQKCATGTAQSPINITTEQMNEVKDNEKIEFHYAPAAFSIINNGHTIQLFSQDETNRLTINEKTYTLVQFHFHAPSEHQIGGQHKQMELHLVHRTPDEQLAVVAVFVEEGTENDVLAKLWDYVEQHSLENETHLPFELFLENLLPSHFAAFQYNGSLTTPPCTENVTWLIMKKTVTFSKKQIDTFRYWFKHNNRPVQPLQKRHVITEEADNQ